MHGDNETPIQNIFICYAEIHHGKGSLYIPFSGTISFHACQTVDTPGRAGVFLARRLMAEDAHARDN